MNARVVCPHAQAPVHWDNLSASKGAGCNPLRHAHIQTVQAEGCAMTLIQKDISAPLDDDQLSEISAGLMFSGKEHRPASECFRCPYCASSDFNVI